MSGDACTKDDVRDYLWRRGQLRFKLWPQQEPIYDGIRGLPRSVQQAVVLCARQFGKSYLGTLLAVEDCLRANGATVLIVGPTKDQTTDIVHQSLRILCEDAPEGLIRRSKSEARWYVGTSELVIGGFELNNATRKRGRSLIKIYIEEVVDSDPDQYTESMRSDLGPALTHAPDAKMIFLTTLPKLTEHPFITETMPQAVLEDAFYSYTIDDNKALTPEQYDACVKRCGGRHTTEFQREYLNKVVRDTNMMIVPDFNKDRHVKPVSLPDMAHYQTVIDFGGVRDKTVGLLVFYDFKRAKLCVKGETAHDINVGTTEIVHGIFGMEKTVPEGQKLDRWADCPGQIQIDLKQEYDILVRLPFKDDWQAGINMMQLAFTWDEIEIDPSCRLLIASLESGQYNKQRTDFGRTKALGHCDALAALMYAIRVVNRTNPYPRLNASPDKTFSRPRPDDDIVQVAKAIQPITIRNQFNADGFRPKRFGSFK